MKNCTFNSYTNENIIIQRPDLICYIIKKNKHISNNEILNWVRPIQNILTEIYYNEKEEDLKNNIKRGLSIWVNDLTFYYDYKNGVVEIYDIVNHNRICFFYKNLLELKLLDNMIGISEFTKEIFKKEIEKSGLIVKDIILGKYKDRFYIIIDDFNLFLRQYKLQKIISKMN